MREIRRRLGSVALTGVGILACLALMMLATPANAQKATEGGGVTIYSETFDADLGTTTATDGGEPSNTWQFRDDCAANPLGGHSAPGTARWGNPGDCGNYGSAGDTDLLDTPVIDISQCDPQSLTVGFNYFLAFQRSNTFDRARVNVIVDGVPTLVADNGDVIGNLVEDIWTPFLTSAADGATLQVQFVGETSDGTSNDDQGFFVDDIDVACTGVPVPTIGVWGLALLLLLLSVVAIFSLRRRTAHRFG